MYVVATAGHVDHGKSTLIKHLTGLDPDRLDEEKRRGLTIELGYASLRLPSGTEMTFVDVPGHERFVPTMLAGLVPLSAVLFVVAADDGWQQQSSEHLAAVDALGIKRGVVVVSRVDLSNPRPLREELRRRLAGTSIADLPVVETSSKTGFGMSKLISELDQLGRTAPDQDCGASTRLWIDRAFTIDGSGTVVTGTLVQGKISAGDKLFLNASNRVLRVRALQQNGGEVRSACAVSRVGVNVARVGQGELKRGDSLVGAGPWRLVSVVDVRTSVPLSIKTIERAVLHIGTASVAVRARRLGERSLRLTLDKAVPLVFGDTGVLRQPDKQRILSGVEVLDPEPPALSGRGAARARGEELWDFTPDRRWRAELRKRQFVHQSDVDRFGFEPNDSPMVAGWYASPEFWAVLPVKLEALVRDWLRKNASQPGMPLHVASQSIALPSTSVVEEALRGTSLELIDGRLRPAGNTLSERMVSALDVLEARWLLSPFWAPTARDLKSLHVSPGEVVLAAQAQRVLVLAGPVLLPPDVAVRAVSVLRSLVSPFTVSDARVLLRTTRRVAVPLLEYLDAHGKTRRLTADHRKLEEPR